MSISAIILAGGRAVRMGGVDKGLVLFQQKPLITHVITRLKPQVSEIIINANREIETYQALGYQVLQDEIADFAGPLAGIQLGLKYASNAHLLTVPCDSPLLPLDLAMRLQAALIAENADISIVSSEDKTHPVFCLCKKSVLTALEDYLNCGGRKVSEWQQSLNHVYVDFSDCAEAFTNLNTQDDLSAFEAKLQSLSPQNSLMTTTKPLPVIGICATGSNSGKTTLINKLIIELRERDIRVSVIKHAHHHFDIDHPGKDSYEIREAGAVQTLVASSKRWALITEMQRTANPPDEADLESLIALINPDYADLILVEGFKNANIPKIEVHRHALGLQLASANDSHFVGVASDEPLRIQTQLPVLNLNDTKQIADFIVKVINSK